MNAVGALRPTDATRPQRWPPAAARARPSAAIFPVTATARRLGRRGGAGGRTVVAALRPGLGNDDAATAGAVDTSTAWVVPPTVAGEPAEPGLLVVNPGDTDVTVTVRLLPLGRKRPRAETT